MTSVIPKQGGENLMEKSKKKMSLKARPSAGVKLFLPVWPSFTNLIKVSASHISSTNV